MGTPGQRQLEASVARRRRRVGFCWKEPPGLYPRQSQERLSRPVWVGPRLSGLYCDFEKYAQSFLWQQEFGSFTFALNGATQA
ncbi:hypothetical protein NDU88_005848 [Pleurodeles waltl]|uniref:Uncharacterized protein n=1 Tax=Pleurodeles waltl TaxID=8319 RepID=A0AAV7NNL0_PLEWA|nr:hypothetical protein NDU88_005848 [Pleurodeles waltl]